MTIEASGSSLIVDPGALTTALVGRMNVVAVVITHEHSDHWTDRQLGHILENNPDTPIFAPAGVARAATNFEITVVTAGDSHEVGPFTLRFFGTKHAVIHE